MRALLVVNPTATTTTAGSRDVVARALASETQLEVRETKARGHAVELARQAVADGVGLVVALGGDGTVNEVVNGLLADGPGPGVPALGVVPAGSTNVFARALGLPDNAVEAAAVLLDAVRTERRRTIGLGLADDRWFTFAAGLGLDAQVVRRVEAHRRSGRRATPGLFVRASLHEYFLSSDRRRPALLLERAGQPAEPVALALVCNTAPWTYLRSRPLLPTPDASFDTGLDVFALRRLRTASTLRHARQILSARPRLRGRELVALHDLGDFVLSAETPQALQVDGDYVGPRSRVTFRAVPAALDVVL